MPGANVLLADMAAWPRRRLSSIGARHGALRTAIGFCAGAGMTFVSSGTAYVLEYRLDVHNPSMVFLCSVVLSAIWFGRAVGVATACFAFLIYNIYLTDPPGRFAFAGLEDLLTLLFFIGAALTISSMAGRLHDERERARERARVFASLFSVSRRILERGGRSEVFDVLIDGVQAVGASDVLILQSEGGEADVVARGGKTPDAPPQVLRAARELLEGRPEASTREEDGWRLHRLDQPRNAAAVLAWRPLPSAKDEAHELAVHLLMELVAVSAERMRLAKQRHELATVAATDRLRTALMSSLSHDFRTPLATILASASSLIEFSERLTPETRRDMLVSIQQEAERLNQFTRNILDMTRLEGDVLRPRQEWSDPLEILEVATERVRRRLGQRSLEFQTPAAAPSIYVDPILAEQALTNVLENAIAHTPDDTSIRVGAAYTDASVALWIEDDGPGVAPSQLTRIFDKFQRLAYSDRAGTPAGLGLGLAIAKGFVEAMSGAVDAMSPAIKGRGLRVSFVFPRTAVEAQS